MGVLKLQYFMRKIPLPSLGEPQAPITCANPLECSLPKKRQNCTSKEDARRSSSPLHQRMLCRFMSSVSIIQNTKRQTQWFPMHHAQQIVWHHLSSVSIRNLAL